MKSFMHYCVGNIYLTSDHTHGHIVPFYPLSRTPLVLSAVLSWH